MHIPSFQIDPSAWVDGKYLRGKELAGEIRKKIRDEATRKGVVPGLAALLVGNDPASEIYVSSKEKNASEMGFYSIVNKMPQTSTTEEILEIVDAWNADDKIHGILVQLPLPRQIDEARVLQTILPEKDADGFHYENMGRLMAKADGTVACTPLGVMVMLKEAGIETTGKNAVVLGRSNIVGKPMAQLLLDGGNCTVTVCHSRTKNINDIISQADILVSAMGVRGIVDESRIKPGSVVIDVGMHRVDGKLKGDLDYEKTLDKVSYVTPVPGGVGPMTIAMLLYNTYRNALSLKGIQL